MLHSPTAMNCL